MQKALAALAERGPISDAADKEEIKSARRVVSLRPDWKTQDALAEWMKTLGFDLGWSYSGWPQASWAFDFHVTLIATKNKVKIPDTYRAVDKLELIPTGYSALGKDGTTAALLVEPNDRITAMRAFFIAAYGAKPTFDEFVPHISVSYRFNGEPKLETLPVPNFPLVFDYLTVGILDDDPPAGVVADEKPEGFVRLLRSADAVTVKGTRKTADGYLQLEARVARTGIQEYAGYEVGDTDNPSKVYRVYRPEDEIFKASSLATFAHKPVTMGHPMDGVSAENWRKEAIGAIGSEVIRDGKFVRVPMVIMDGGSIEEIEAGTREISMGYDCDLAIESGVTPDGQAYDAIQKNIRINHAAVVPRGRAGHECRIGDARTPQQQEDTLPMKKITIGDKQHEVSDEVAAHIAHLETRDAEFTKASKQAGIIADQWDATLETHKTDMAAKDAEIAALKGQVVTSDQMQAAVEERTSVVDAAKTLSPELDPKGKTLADIRAEAVRTASGNAYADKDPVKNAEFFEALFGALCDRAKSADTPEIKALKDGGNKPVEHKSVGQALTDRYRATMNGRSAA